MLRPRLIPCLLIRQGGLVKTTKFTAPKYVGDPINAVRIFNEKMADELIVFDIEATQNNTEPNYKLIARLANECRMPMSYGGGVKTTEQIEHIISLGVEKVSVSAAAVESPKLISQAASRVGSQSIVAVLEIKKIGLRRKFEVVTHNGTRRSHLDPVDLAKNLQDYGVGEIVIQSVDLDGTMRGYDLDLVSRFLSTLSVPLTIVGGAGSLNHISELWSMHGLLGAAAGSLFVFKGKYRAVLINYPNFSEKETLIKAARK